MLMYLVFDVIDKFSDILTHIPARCLQVLILSPSVITLTSLVDMKIIAVALQFDYQLYGNYRLQPHFLAFQEVGCRQAVMRSLEAVTLP